MSPTPTAGLGGGDSPVAGLSSFSDPSPSFSPPHSISPSTSVSQQREGRERIRNVWESFRDRLGLNRNASSRTGDLGPSGSDDTGNMRPGELMLAEMARALNIGLGLNGDGSATGPPAQNAESATSNSLVEVPRSQDHENSRRSIPAEDSFERFLINLQADLRTALSGDSSDAAASNGADEREEVEVSPSSEERSSSSLSFLESSSQHDDQDINDALPLEDVSEDEYEVEAEYEDPGLSGPSSTRSPTPMPATTPFSPNRLESAMSPTPGEHGDLDRRPPGINLWRLYRFQPIPASQVAGHAASTTSPTPAIPLSPPLHSPPPAVSPVAQPPRPASQSSDTNPSLEGVDSSQAESVPTTDAISNVVVPVIVVGLQSVDMGQVHGHAHPEDDPTPPDSWDSGRRSTSSDDTPRTDSPVDDSGVATPRGRSWQSRAATALRSLRPGRRNGSRGQQAVDGSGSRTFLIYVIGGKLGPYSCYEWYPRVLARLLPSKPSYGHRI